MAAALGRCPCEHCFKPRPLSLTQYVGTVSVGTFERVEDYKSQLVAFSLRELHVSTAGSRASRHILFH